MSPDFAASVSQAQRAIASAQALFHEGLLAECHAYMSRALRLLLDAWASIEPSGVDNPDPAPRREQALAVLERAGYPRTARVRAALAATPEPSLDGSAPPRDCDWIWAEVERLALRSVRQAKTARARKLGRWRLGGLAALLLGSTVLVSLRVWGQSRVHASSTHSTDYPAALAFDGLEATEWLLPDGETGWLELSFRSPRAIHSVSLVNSHNAYFFDRASRALRVTAFSQDGKVTTVEGSFPKITDERSLLELPLEATDVARLRIDVLTYFGVGGGLAEIEVH